MIKYKVIVSSKAKDDIESIFDYIAYDLNAYTSAMRQYNRITDAILSLTYFPHRIKTINASLDFDNQLRRLNVDGYAILFVIEGYNVIILKVVHGSSDIEKMLRKH